jgi:CARDB
MKNVISIAVSLFLVFAVSNTVFAQDKGNTSKPIDITGIATAPLPDLAPVQNSQVIRAGFFIFYVENRGNKEASASVTEVRYDGKVELVNTPKLAPGASVKLTIRYGLTQCNNTAVTTDINKTVVESVESNNTKKYCWVD